MNTILPVFHNLKINIQQSRQVIVLLVRNMAAALISLFIAACASAPLDFPKEYSEALPDTGGTHLGREIAEWTAGHPGKSGFYPLTAGIDADRKSVV